MIELLKRVGKWVRFAYFLRFAWMLWLFAPLLCLINIGDKTLTSGILISENWQQYLCVAFFIVSSGFAALVLARIALINGPERWDLTAVPPNDCRPSVLKNLFVNDEGKLETLAAFVSQIPSILVFTYLLHFGVCQGVDAGTIMIGLGLGTLMAFICWWNANAWYYLTFKARALTPAPVKFILAQNAARTILFPRAMFLLNRVDSVCPGKPTIEQADTLFSGKAYTFLDQKLRLEAIRKFFIDRTGYGPPGGSSFYEAHNFAAIGVIVFLGLYLLIWPLTAPVVAPVTSVIAIVVLLAFIVLVIIVFWRATPATVGNTKGSLTRVRWWITISLGLFFAAIAWLWVSTAADRFPIFATILIMAISVCWILGEIAFFLDRYRVPVITFFILALIGPRMFHLDRTVYVDGSGLHAGNGEEEHYLSITAAKSNDHLPFPQEVLKSRLAAITDGRPLIIVTATGGGLHASAWTATVLAHLEAEFGGHFDDHLLLASTVSGGSVGLLSYLNELHAKSPDWERMEASAQCSSLEGAGWGLVYYDLPKALIPLFPYAVPPSSGDGDLDTSLAAGHTPLGKDRTWALRKAFLRNLDDDYCWRLWKLDHGKDPKEGSRGNPSVFNGDPTGNGITVRDFPSPRNPAFSMNTTVVESGDRFLSANYRIPECLLEDDRNPEYRARSFLETYKTRNENPSAAWSDLPLATAAQISATFPYVSSSARAPIVLENDATAVHFADGGYYDNDGTASAIEFLRYALGPSDTPGKSSNSSGPTSNRCPSAGFSEGKPLRILLIEIRNSGGIPGSDNDESTHLPTGGSTPWNLFNQVVAPLLGFWQAGHQSITARDQSGLELLEHAYPDTLIVRSVVLADQSSVYRAGTDPLNWALTPKQRKEVRDNADARDLTDFYKIAKSWFDAKDPETWKKPPADDGGPQESREATSTH
jgi:hypothetical protein